MHRWFKYKYIMMYTCVGILSRRVQPNVFDRQRWRDYTTNLRIWVHFKLNNSNVTRLYTNRKLSEPLSHRCLRHSPPRLVLVAVVSSSAGPLFSPDKQSNRRIRNRHLVVEHASREAGCKKRSAVSETFKTSIVFTEYAIVLLVAEMTEVWHYY